MYFYTGVLEFTNRTDKTDTHYSGYAVNTSL